MRRRGGSWLLRWRTARGIIHSTATRSILGPLNKTIVIQTYLLNRAAGLWYDLTEKQKEATQGFKMMETKLNQIAKEKPETESPTKASPLKKTKRLVKHDNENNNDYYHNNQF